MIREISPTHILPLQYQCIPKYSAPIKKWLPIQTHMEERLTRIVIQIMTTHVNYELVYNEHG